MNFYSILSKYYDEVFPVKKEMINFIGKKKQGNKILDIGCGNGKFDLKLVEEGEEITAIDLDDEMIYEAKEISSKENPLGKVDFKVMNMKDIGSNFKGDFDTVICLGNTIVHLNDSEEIKAVLREINLSLKENGKIIVQLINYDRILNKDIRELPIIETSEVLFKREYERIGASINFKTTIYDKNSKKEYKNETKLYPMLKGEFEKLLKETGFKNLEFYGDYIGTPYAENSYHTIAIAKK